MVQGVNISAMVDTGAAFTLINERIYPLIHAKIADWPYPRLIAVDKRDVTPKIMLVDVKIGYCGKEETMSIGVLREMSYNMILGMDFLTKFGLTIDVARKIIMPTETIINQFKSLYQNQRINLLMIRQLTEQNLKLLEAHKEMVGYEDSTPEENSVSVMSSEKPDINSVNNSSDSSEEQNIVVDNVSESEMPEENNINLVSNNVFIQDIEDKSSRSKSSETITKIFQCRNGTESTEQLSELPEHFRNFTEEMFLKNTRNKIIPKVSSEYLFGVSERRLVNLQLNETQPGLFITKTLPSAKKQGWSVEKGVINADSNSIRVWVLNRNLRPKRLKVGDTLFSLHAMSAEECDLIDINPPVKSSINSVEIRKKGLIDQKKKENYDSYNQKVWNRINSVPGPEYLYLTDFERSLPDDHNYFTVKLNVESYERWNVSTDLTPKQKFMFSKLLEKYRDIFAFKGDSLGQIKNWVHKIDTGDHPPIKQNPYRTSESQKAQIQECINEMMEKGVIVPCVSSWSSPITLVPKRDGTIRFCIDYRKLNAITKDDLYPIPRLDEPLTLMRGSKFFSTMDCDSCYWQIPLDLDSMEKTTFTCHLGTFMFKVMPFGLKCAPASCVRAMDRIFRDENRRISFIYMDDLICFSDTAEEHIRRLTILFDTMRENGLKLKAKKCDFANNSVNYLGHTITIDGVSPDKSRLNALTETPRPESVDAVRSFLGFCSFYRNYIINFAMLAEPLTKLLRKNVKFKWTDEQENTRNILIEKLTNAPVLAHFDPAKRTELRVDASNFGLGAHLVQIDGEHRQLLACASRTLLKHEKNYSTTEKECLAIVFGLKKFRPYLFGRKFTIITDHCGLCFLMHAKDLENRLARWSLRIMDYDFDIVYNKGIKHQDADYLSRNPFKEKKSSEQLPEDFEINSVIAYVRPEIEHEPIDFSKWTPEETIQEQKIDPILKDIYDLCENPERLSQNSCRKFQRIYQLKNGVLHRRNNVFGIEKFVLCVPLNLVRQILFYAHDSPTAGHFGQRKTYWKVSQNFYWRGMATDVRNYVRSCKECQFRKTRTTLNHSFQGTIPVPENVFEEICIDLVGPLPPTDDGNKYIVTVIDSLSKYAVTYPVKNATDEEIMHGLESNLFYVFGPPKKILKDQGTNLNSIYCESVYNRWNIKSVRTTPYHPQGNGLTERLNKTLGVGITTMIPTEKDLWDQYLKPVTFAYNTTLHESTGFTPIELVTGINQNLSITGKIGFCPEKCVPNLTIDEKRRIARQNILRSQSKNQKYKNEDRIPCDIKEGDLVLIYSVPLKMKRGGKFENRWIGPFRVIKRQSEQVFSVISMTGSVQNVRQVNATQMKKYYDRSDFELCALKNS